MEALQQMEAAMVNRANKIYYWRKIKHAEFYNDCMKDHARYCTPDMLAMSQHNCSTQRNEAMNHLVATLAPKTNGYSKKIITYKSYVVSRYTSGWAS